MISRRGLIVSGIAVGGGAAFFYGLQSLKDGDAKEKFLKTTPNSYALHAYVKINPEGKIIIAVPAAELGQGVTTSIPMIIAEELDANWDDVTYELAPLDKDYGSYIVGEVPRLLMDPGIMRDVARTVLYKVSPLVGMTITAGSTAILGNYIYLRNVGAMTRSMLISAAAKRLGVIDTTLITKNSLVIHPQSGRSLTYGELAEEASFYKPKSKPKLKNEKDFSIIGKPIKRLDAPEKVDGSAIYGIDIKFDNLLFASIKHCPYFGGKLKSFDTNSIKGTDGVIKVVRVFDNAVAVIAKNTWIAQRALSKINIKWEKPKEENFDSELARKNYLALLDSDSLETLEEDNNFKESWDKTSSVLEAVYETPYLAHVCMEPMGCTALYEISDGQDSEDAKITVWSPSQSSSWSKSAANEVAEVKSDNVQVYSTLMGGGFGRRAKMDFVKESVSIAKQLPNIPIKLTWTREEDTTQDFYRPDSLARLRMGLDSAEIMTALDFSIVTKPINEKSSLTHPMSYSAYNLPPKKLTLSEQNNPIPVGQWRSVSMSHNGFYLESFIDELANRLDVDPLRFRLNLLKDKPECSRLLEFIGKKSKWEKPLKSTLDNSLRGRGVSFIEAFQSVIAQVVEVTISKDKHLTIDRVINVVNPHKVINPDTIKAQMESCSLEGLSAALYGKIKVRNGKTIQENFDTYRLISLRETPDIETYILPQGGHPGGIGEVGLPGVAPALTNAIFNATGVRIRKLPISESEFTV